MRYNEFSKHVYTLFQVLDAAKKNKYKAGFCPQYSVYHAYVGRHDQPDVYDKRACLILKDAGEKVVVFKITEVPSKNPLRYEIKDHEDLNFEGPSYIRLDEKPYYINKDWITTYDGELHQIDANCIDKLLQKSAGQEI